MTRFQKLFLTIAVFLCLIPFSTVTKAETLEETLRRLQQEIAALQNQKSQLQSQISSNNYTISGYNQELSKLLGEAQIYQKDLDQLNLEVKELEVKIQLLDEEIKATESEIQKNVDNINFLEKESNKRLKNSYRNYRLYGSSEKSSSLGVLGDINNYFKDSQYKEIIQSESNDIVSNLSILKAELENQKKELAGKLEQVKKDRELVVIKQEDVKKKNDEVEAKMAIFYQEVALLNNKNLAAQNQFTNYSKDEAEKRRQANAVQLAIANSYTSVPAGTFVLEGTVIGLQGCTGLCTGPHLHFMVYNNGVLNDPCAWLSGGVCGYGNGAKVQWPLRPVSYYTSPMGSRCIPGWGCDYHNGIDIVGSYSTAPIYSAHSGYLVKGVDSYGAKYIIICENTNCNNGIKTGYWHLSSY